jgi:hypothetical protein
MTVKVSTPGIAGLPRRVERKFCIPPQRIGLAYGLLRPICPPDRRFPYEQITSLYFDTFDLDQYERSDSGDYRKDKVRIRWYSEDKNIGSGMRTVYVELKSREGFASTKQRLELQVPADNIALHNLENGIIPKTLITDTLAGFGYFPPDPLQPILMISYWRYRFVRSSQVRGYRSITVMFVDGGARHAGHTRRCWSYRRSYEIKCKMWKYPGSKEAGVLGMDWSGFRNIQAVSITLRRPCRGFMSPSGRIISYI